MIVESLIQTIKAAAIAAKLSPALLLAVCYTETNLTNIVVPQDGRRASTGVCQVQLPAARLVAPGIHPSSLMNPEINARVAALYLRYQINRYHNEACGIEAYNKGYSAICSKKAASQLDTSTHFRHTKYVDKVYRSMRRRPWIQLQIKEWQKQFIY